MCVQPHGYFGKSTVCSHATAALKDKWMNASSGKHHWFCVRGWYVGKRISDYSAFKNMEVARAEIFLILSFCFWGICHCLRHWVYIWCCILTVCVVKALWKQVPVLSGKSFDHLNHWLSSYSLSFFFFFSLGILTAYVCMNPQGCQSCSLIVQLLKLFSLFILLPI